MISKRTKVFAAVSILCGVFVYVGEYKDFRSYQELRASWRGQEKVFDSMDIAPHVLPLVTMAFFAGTVSLVVGLASVVVDISHFWRRPQK
jgi:hypothetical protein